MSLKKKSTHFDFFENFRDKGLYFLSLWILLCNEGKGNYMVFKFLRYSWRKCKPVVSPKTLGNKKLISPPPSEHVLFKPPPH